MAAGANYNTSPTRMNRGKLRSTTPSYYCHVGTMRGISTLSAWHSAQAHRQRHDRRQACAPKHEGAEWRLTVPPGRPCFL